MKRLADGDLDVRIEGRERGDEIGEMVRSVSVFRNAALENIRLDQEARRRENCRAQKRSAVAPSGAYRRRQRQALTALAGVLASLAEGDLETLMDEKLPDDFAEMASTYNLAVEALRATLSDVRSATSRSTAEPAIWQLPPMNWRTGQNSRPQLSNRVRGRCAI